MRTGDSYATFKTIIMKTITYLLAFSFIVLSSVTTFAQEEKTPLQKLEASKEKVINYEKDALKKVVETINKQVEEGKITLEEGEKLKKEAAEKRALNIENKVAIIDNKIALLERNGIPENEDARNITIGLSLGNDDETENFLGLKYDDESQTFERKYDVRTFSEFVFAFGLNNTISEGESFDESPYKVGRSRFTEIGVSFSTRVFKESNWLRFKYGVSFQFNGLNADDNLFQVDTGTETELQPFGQSLDKSKFRMDNLVVPVFFELGPSKKVEKEDYFRYNTDKSFKIGLGGYAGVNLGARQKLKYELDGDQIKEKSKADFNTNNFIYGLAGYIGYSDMSLYVKYDLNPIFRDNPVQRNNISLGLRWDWD